jgi:hypothetical protein
MAQRRFPATATGSMAVLLLLPLIFIVKICTAHNICPMAAPNATTVYPQPNAFGLTCYIVNITAVPAATFVYDSLPTTPCMSVCAATAKKTGTLFWFWETGVGQVFGGYSCACYGGGPCEDHSLFKHNCDAVGVVAIGVFGGPNGTTAAFSPPPSPRSKRPPPPSPRAKLLPPPPPGKKYPPPPSPGKKKPPPPKH